MRPAGYPPGVDQEWAVAKVIAAVFKVAVLLRRASAARSATRALTNGVRSEYLALLMRLTLPSPTTSGYHSTACCMAVRFYNAESGFARLLLGKGWWILTQ